MTLDAPASPLTDGVAAATIGTMPLKLKPPKRPEGRPRSRNPSALGLWLDARGRSREWLAETLGITVGFAHKLARGDALPSIPLAYEIQRLTGGKVGLKQWAETAVTQNARRR